MPLSGDAQVSMLTTKALYLIPCKSVFVSVRHAGSHLLDPDLRFPLRLSDPWKIPGWGWTQQHEHVRQVAFMVLLKETDTAEMFIAQSFQHLVNPSVYNPHVAWIGAE